MSSRRSARSRASIASHRSISYSATTFSHRLAGENDAAHGHGGENKENVDRLANVVLSKSLSIYRASPLFNLSYKKRVLKALARKIGLHIQKVDMWGDREVGAAGTQNLIAVNAVPVIGHRDQPAGILVTVTTTSEYGDNGDVDRAEVFWGLFCNPVESLVATLREKFLDLPLVLVKGRLSLVQEILTFFTKQFDCTVEKFQLAPLELTWLGAMYSGFAADIPRRPLKLVYATPEEIAGIDSITMSIAANNVADLWKCIHAENSDDFLFNEVTVFTKSLEAHFEKYFKLNLAFFTLKSVMVTSLYAESSGKIKILSPMTSYRILAHVLSIIRQEMNT